MYKANAMPRINLSPTISDYAHFRADDATYDIRPYDMTTNSAYHDANFAYHDATSAYHDAVPRQGKNKQRNAYHNKAIPLHQTTI